MNGSIATISPIYYQIPLDLNTRIESIPVTMHNHYAVPVAVTHVGIPEIAATLVSISDRADFSRFIVNVSFMLTFR